MERPAYVSIEDRSREGLRMMGENLSIIPRGGRPQVGFRAFLAAVTLGVLAALSALLAGLTVSPAVALPLALDRVDRIRLAEAFRLADRLGDRIWKGWHKAPFAVLLVTPEAEYLVRHPNPPADYLALGEDPLLHAKVYAARRTHPLNILATFPINGVPTIVVGQAQNTEERSSSRWVIVLLHEHFHQLQYADPAYYEAVDALGLAGGDATGMWMLNYPFPYDAIAVKARFQAMALSLIHISEP